MLGSLGDMADTFKGVINGFATASWGAFNAVWDLATGSLD